MPNIIPPQDRKELLPYLLAFPLETLGDPWLAKDNVSQLKGRIYFSGTYAYHPKCLAKEGWVV